MALQTYQDMAQIYDVTLSNGVNNVIQNAVANNAANFTDALTIYIIIVVVLAMFRETTPGTLVLHLMRAAIIAALLTAEGFQTYIATPAMDTVPAWIAQTVNGANGIAAGPQQFDVLWQKVDTDLATIYGQATGFFNMAYRAEASIYGAIIKSFITIEFWVYEMSRSMMGIIVATVPFILFMFLFQATRQVPLNAARHIIGLFILQLMLGIMLQIMLAGEMQFLTNNPVTAAVGLDEQLDMMVSIAEFTAFGVGMVVIIPFIASYIGGGIAVTTGAALMTRFVPGLNVAHTAASRLASAMRSAGNRIRRK